jgi:uncharacterized integral membrane protein
LEKSFSKLTIQEFHKKLRILNKFGNPKSIFVPISALFSFSEIPFCGLFNESKFSLTSNTNVRQSFYMIQGSYKISNEKLQIQYAIKSRFKYKKQMFYIWTLYVIGFLIFVNFKIYDTSEPIVLMILVNVAGVLMIIFAYLDDYFARKNLEKNLKQFLKSIISLSSALKKYKRFND